MRRAYQRPAYPATWAKMDGRGRVFYTSMGHREDVWTNKTFQQIVLGASVGLWVMLTPTSHRTSTRSHR
ncbi:MAG: ThuA domain-containing protein [Thermoguttaceae bacterium]